MTVFSVPSPSEERDEFERNADVLLGPRVRDCFEFGNDSVEDDHGGDVDGYRGNKECDAWV